MRFGIIGSNHITENFYEAGKLCENFEITAIYSRTQQRAEEVAGRYGAKYAFSNIEDLANCGEVDAVYIASPNALHCQHTIRMLKAKKHVLCEKPIASNCAELESMLDTARENNCILLEAMRPSFLPTMAVIKENLMRIGPVRNVVLNFSQYSSRYNAFKSGIIENAFNPELSNGALMDIGVYCAHVLVHLFGAPKAIKASGLKLENGVDGQGTIIAEYDHMTGILIYSKITNAYSQSEIQGENGCIFIDTVSGQRKIWLVKSDSQRIDISLPIVEDDMYYEITEFIKYINGEISIKQYQQYQQYTIDTMKLMDGARAMMGIEFPADK